MAQYIKKEMPDMNGTGKNKAYYKLKTWRRLETDEFINPERCCVCSMRTPGIRDCQRIQR